MPALLPLPSPSASPGKVFFFSMFLYNCCKETIQSKLITFALCSARMPVYQPGHWLGLVTRLGWLGQAQPPKKRKKEKRVG
jgi:hypothetical protein